MFYPITTEAPCLAIRGGGGLHNARVAKQNRAALDKTVDIAARIEATVINIPTSSVVVPGIPGDGEGGLVSQGPSRDAGEADFHLTADGIAQVADKAAEGMQLGDKLTDDKKSLDYARGLIEEITAEP